MSHHIVIDARIRRASTGRYVDRLLQHLQTVDTFNTYTVLLSAGDPWRPTVGNFKTLPCPFPQFSLSPLPDLQFALLLYRLKPDLVHFTMTQQPLLYFGKIVTTTHDLTMFEFVRLGTTPAAVFWLKMQLYHFLMWWSHHKSNRIIVPTRTVADEVAAFQPFTKKKLAVTYEATEPPIAAPAVQPKGISGDFIMYLGNAFPHKNILELVKAFDLLHKQRPALKLVLVGKKEKHYIELQEQVQQFASKDNIFITGFLPDEEAKWLYQHCKAYVFPSLMEGFGLPALEAMAHGAVVAASYASCIPEVCGDAAHYFDPRDPNDMATKIADVLDDKKLREQLHAAAKEQIKKYSWHTMAEETLDVYQDVLAPENEAKEPEFE
ncbi:MAG TPA: glycosyltransferase family 1 protein [Candidatus Saccharimonadales bacterium]|jgi:glycosyltransferase involved in cell wall biosynthesis|nr:glycosyltransferase family 1 protein [Candidatus Saccharimonadales bacterium]